MTSVTSTTTTAPSLVASRPNPLPAIGSNAHPPTSTPKGETEKKRGPGRPPGSTKSNIEHQRLLQQQQLQLQQQGDIVKVNNNKNEPVPPAIKKAKLDFESGPPTLSSALAPPAAASIPPSSIGTGTHHENKTKYNIDVVNNNPLKWNVTQVCDFVKTLPGCSDYVEDFQLQEIDGQALMLLKADHLMSAMAIKLGPALKICNAIEAMREELKQN